jgi:hypothetical protein
MANMVAGNPGATKRWGAFSDADFTVTANSLKAGGLLPANFAIKPGALYTNQFVAAYNRFDPAKVAARAKAYKP